jgi:ABC-2 type transport system ATP-binding protein
MAGCGLSWKVLMTAMIDAQGLKKTYRGRGAGAGARAMLEAVKGIDLKVEKGEIVGFLGPNGAGKTTTLRMLATLLEPSAGQARIAGSDLRRDPVAVRRQIGYVAQVGTTDPDAIAGEELVDHARLYGTTSAEAMLRGKALLHELDLSDCWQRKCGSLSGGQRRRLDIAMGLIHRPVLVFLDEPSTGLDPQSRANLWGHIREIRERHQTTLFITTHYMDEADALCDRIVIIDHGQIVAQDTPSGLKRRLGGDTLRLTLDVEADPGAALRIVQDTVEDSQPELDGACVRLRTANGGSTLPRLLSALGSGNVTVVGVELHRPTLDDVFLNLTGRSLRDNAEN